MSDVPMTVTRAPASGCPLAWSVTRPATVPCWARATAPTPPTSPPSASAARSVERMAKRIRIPPDEEKPSPRGHTRRAWPDDSNCECAPVPNGRQDTIGARWDALYELLRTFQYELLCSLHRRPARVVKQAGVR